MSSLPPLILSPPPPPVLLLPHDAAPNASAHAPAVANTERGFKTRIPLSTHECRRGSYSAQGDPAPGFVSMGLSAQRREQAVEDEPAAADAIRPEGAQRRVPLRADGIRSHGGVRAAQAER